MSEQHDTRAIVFVVVMLLVLGFGLGHEVRYGDTPRVFIEGN